MENQNQNTQTPNTVFTPTQEGVRVSSPMPQTTSSVPQATISPTTATYEPPIIPDENSLENAVPTTSFAPTAGITQPPASSETPILPKKPRLSKAFLIITGVAAIIVLAVGGLASYISQRNVSQLQSPSGSVNEQGITLGDASPDVLSVLQLKGSQNKLIVNGDVITTGRISMASGDFYGQFVANNLTTNQEYVFPDASGTICLDVNNCNFATDGDFVSSISGVSGPISLGTGLSLNGSTLTNSQTQTTINNLSGAITLQGTENQINVSNSSNVVTLSTPQDIANTSSPTFASVNITSLNVTGSSTSINGIAYTWPGSQLNGVLVNDGSGGLTWSAVAAACPTCFVNGGNSFGGTATLGTNDNNNLVFETNNTVRMRLNTSGHIGLGNLDSANPDDCSTLAIASCTAVININENVTDFTPNLVAGVNNVLTLSATADSSNEVAGVRNTVGATGAFNYGTLRGDLTSLIHAGSGDITFAEASHVGVTTSSSGDIAFAKGLQADVFHAGSGVIASGTGVSASAITLGSGSMTSATAVYAQAGSVLGSGDLTTVKGIEIQTGSSSATGTITDNYSLFINSANNTGAITNNYGIYIEDQSGAGSSNSYNLYSQGSGYNLLQGSTAIGPDADVENEIVSFYSDLGLNTIATLRSQTEFTAGAVNGYYFGSSNEVITSPSSPAGTSAYAAQSNAIEVAATASTIGAVGAEINLVDVKSTNAINNVYGNYQYLNLRAGSNVSALSGYSVQGTYNATSTINNYHGMALYAPTGGTVNNMYGLYIGDHSGGASSSYNIYSDGNGYNYFNGTIIANTLGTADTATFLCRNSTNQLASCNTTGAGAAFVQGGNTFGATATLGTNDANSLVFETNNQTAGTIASGGAVTFQNNTDTTSGFRVLDADGGHPVLNIDTTNEWVGIGTATPTHPLHVIGVGIRQERFNGIAQFLGDRAEGTQDAPTAVGNNTLLAITGRGYDGTNYINAGQIAFATDGGGVGTNDMPGRITFATTADGASSQTERMRLTSTGLLEIASTSAGGTVEKFRVNTPTTVDNLAATMLATGATTSKALVVQGAASQTANLQEWQNSAGTVMASIGATGAALFQNTTDSTSGFQVLDADGGTSILQVDTTNERVSIGDSTPDYTLDVEGASTSSTAATEYLSHFTFNDTGAVSSGTDLTIAQRIDVNRTGGSGSAVLQTYGGQAIVIGDTGGTSTAVGYQGIAAGADSNYGLSGGALVVTSTSVSEAIGVDAGVSTFGAGGSATSAYALQGAITMANNSTYTTAAGLNVKTATNTGGGTIGTNYGIWVNAQTVGGSDYGLRVDTADTQTLWIGGTAAGDGGTANTGIAFGSTRDTNLYRSAAGVLKTDTAMNVGASLTGTTAGLTVSNGTSTGNVLTLNDNVTAVVQVADGGAAVFQNATNSTRAFRISDSAGTDLFNINTLTSGLNLVANPNFEQNTNGWSAKGSSTIALDDTASNANFGARSLRITTTAAANDGASYRFPFASSTQYSLSFYAKVSSGSTNAISFGNAAAGIDVDCLTGQTLTTTWAQYTCTFTSALSPTSTGNFYIKQSDTTARTIYIDGVTLVTGSTALAYTNPAQNIQVGSAMNNVTLNYQNTGEPQQWNASANALNAARYYGRAVVANGYIYLVGGDSGSAATTTVQYARINNDGSTGTWSTTSALPSARENGGVAYGNGYIYYIGGDDTNNGTSATSTIYYAKVNTDGTLGTWQTNATGWGATRNRTSTVILNGYIYTLSGGNNATSYFAKLNADGSVGPSVQTTANFSANRNRNAALVANGYIYVLGGDSTGTATTTVSYARPAANGDISAWTNASNSLPAARFDGSAVAANGYLYYMGGTTNATSGNLNVYYTKLNNDGSTGTWQTATNSLPTSLFRASAVTANGYVYHIGGASANATAVDTVYYMSLPRVMMGGSLDLVGLSAAGGLSDGSDSGSVGGSLTAGSAKIVGSLDVQGSASFANNVYINRDVTVKGAATFQSDKIGGMAVMTSQNSLEDVWVQGRYVYGVSNGSTDLFRVIDVSNPMNPTSIATLATSDNPNAVTVQGRYAYVVSTAGASLQIIDISNPKSPTIVSTTALGVNAQDVYVQGRYAYVLFNTGTTMAAYDVSNPAAPVSAGTVTIANSQRNIFVQGNYAYITTAGTNDKVYIVNITNPTSMSVVNSGGTTVGDNPQGIYVSGRYAYVANNGANSLTILDVSDPSTPTTTSTTTLTASNAAAGIFVQGKYAYITSDTGSSTNRFLAMDISNPAVPITAASFDHSLYTSTSAMDDIYVQGRYAYVVNPTSTARLEVIDLGGVYVQQLEVGGLESAGTIGAAGNITGAGDLGVQGSGSFGRGINVDGQSSFSLTSTSTTAATATLQSLNVADSGIVTTGSDANIGQSINMTRSLATNGSLSQNGQNITLTDTTVTTALATNINTGQSITVTRSGNNGGTDTNYGQNVSVTGTVTSGSVTNYGINVQASGSLTGTSVSYGVNSRVGGALDGFSDSNYGGYFNAESLYFTGTTTTGQAVGAQGNVTLKTGTFGVAPTATLTDAMALRGSLQVDGSLGGTATITNGHGLYIDAASTNTGAITNNYGVLIKAQTAGTADYGVAIEATDTTAGNATVWVSSNTDSTGASGGITFGSSKDTNLYRSAANTLKTDDAFTAAGLLTGSAGATVSGATVSINASSNFATNINTGTSSGTVTIGNSSAAVDLSTNAGTFTSSGALSLTAGNLNLNTTGTGNTAIGNSSGTNTITGISNFSGNVAGYVATFDNNGNNANRNGISIQAGADDGSGTTTYIDFLDGDGTEVGYCQNASGTFACSDSSDIRTKTNINNSAVDAEAILNGLRVVDFNRIQNPDGPLITGFIAQEVQALYGQAVTTGSNGYLGVARDQLVPILVKGHQNQQVAINGLDTRLGTVESGSSQLNALAQRVSQLEVQQSQGSGSSFADLNVSGVATVQTLKVTGAATIGQLTVTGNATFASNITIQGHVLGNADTRGTVTVPAGQVQAKVTFEKPYSGGSQPNVILTPKNTFAPKYRVESSETDFTVFFETASSGEVIMNYQVQE